MMYFLEKFSSTQHISAFALLILFLVVEFAFQRLKSRKRNDYNQKKPTLESLEDIEEVSLEHYKNLQQIDVVRFLNIIIGIIAVLAVYNVQAFNILAVATGAFILALRETFTSLVAYFYILSNYKLGDDIRINTALGELVRVKPLYVALAGKEENGEYNSILYHIPNFMFLNQLVEQQQLKSDDYRKTGLQVLYSKEIFDKSFNEIISLLEKYLDDLLPVRPMTKVGYFRGYAGLKYKINYDYAEKGEIVIKVSFIARVNKAIQNKESIISFIEGLKK